MPALNSLAIAVLALLTVACCSEQLPSAPEPSVSVEDARRFSAAMATWTPADTSCNALAPYWRAAGPGLRAYQEKFDATFDQLCRAVRRSPDSYRNVVALQPGLDSASAQAKNIYARFARDFGLVGAPAVYVVVGTGISGGTTTRGRRPMVLLSAERMRSTHGLSGTIAHELAHTQQRYPWWGALTGGPSLLRGSLLRVCVMEGSADLVKELLTGQPIRNAYGEAHEHGLWLEFRDAAASKDYRRWLYNGGDPARGERPPDLGYWMGYRIAKAYYNQAADKRAAIREMLTIRDFEAFLRTSKYAGGKPG